MPRVHPIAFRRDERGATIVEFAIVAPVFFLLILGILEFGLFMFHRIAVEAITVQAGRETTIGRSAGSGACAGTPDKVKYIECYVREKSKSLIRGADTIIQVNPISQGGTFTPDICKDNPNRPSSAPTSCKLHEEINQIPEYQGARASNTGGAGEIVEVRVIYPWRVLIPFVGKFFGTPDAQGKKSGVVLITSSTIVKNEPF